MLRTGDYATSRFHHLRDGTSRSGDDLVLHVGSSGDRVTVQGAFLDLHHALAQINFAYTEVTYPNGPNGIPEVQKRADTFFGPELTAAFPPGQSGPYPLTGFVFIRDTGNHAPNPGYDHNSIIIHADGAGLTNAGNGNTVVLTGKGSYLNLTGQGTVLTSNGNSDVASLSGDQVRVVMNGISDQLYLTGSSGTLTLNGGGGTVGMYGNDDTLTANGDGTHITVGGQRDKVGAGNADITVGDGTGTAQGGTLLVTGAYNTVRIGSYVGTAGQIGADIGAYATAVLLTGTGNNVKLGTQYGSLTDTGTNSKVPVNAQDTAVKVAGTNNVGAEVNGLRNTVAVAGSGNHVAVNGQDNSITLGGTGNTLGTAGNSITILDDTVGATLTGGGSTVSVGSRVRASILASGGEQVTLAGGDTTLTKVSGGYGTVTVTGQRDTVTVEGPGNKVVVAGTGNTTYVSGYAPQVQVSGTGQVLQVDNGTVRIAGGAQVTVTGYASPNGNYNEFSNGNRFVLGAAASLSLATGGNNYVEASSGSTVSLNGTGNGLSASGTGNFVTLSGTGADMGQDGYARMGGSTLVLKAGGIATLTGDNDLVTVEAGAKLRVAGTGNAVAASAATVTFDGPATPALPGSPLAVRGFGFPAAQAGDYDPAASAGSLAGLAATGANAVELVVTQFLASLTATTISATSRTESDANLVAEIGAAKARGLSVLLKPHIDSETNEWRAFLDPSSKAAFFANYKAFIVHYAQIAQQAHADQFCIGAELQSLSGTAYRAQWLDIIAAVRQAYAGPITYASAGFETGGVSFWDKVDVIGANAYERVSAEQNPTLAQLEQGWTQPTPRTGPDLPSGGDPIDNQPQTDGFGEKVEGDGSKSFYSGPMGSAPSGTVAVSPLQFYQDLAAKYGKQVLFTEAGYASVNQTNKLQGDGRRSGTTYVDYQQQALATQAFLDVFTQNKGTWLQGAYLWYWNPNTAGVIADDSSVQDKPALDVVKAYYGGTPASSAAVANRVAGDGNTVEVGKDQALRLIGSNNTVRLATAAAGGKEELAISGAGNTVALGVASGQLTSVRTDAAGDVVLALATGGQVSFDGMAAYSTWGAATVSFTDGSKTRAQLLAMATSGAPAPATVFRPSVRSDFDGDGRSDILFRNNGTGDHGYQTLTASGDAGSYVGLGGSNPAYSVVGTGDFNGDGRSDILFRNNATGDYGYEALTPAGQAGAYVSLGGSNAGYGVPY